MGLASNISEVKKTIIGLEKYLNIDNLPEWKLPSEIMCRLQNPKALALHHKISAALFHRLNRLGVAVSPKYMVYTHSKQVKSCITEDFVNQSSFDKKS